MNSLRSAIEELGQQCRSKSVEGAACLDAIHALKGVQAEARRALAAIERLPVFEGRHSLLDDLRACLQPLTDDY